MQFYLCILFEITRVILESAIKLYKFQDLSEPCLLTDPQVLNGCPLTYGFPNLF